MLLRARDYLCGCLLAIVVLGSPLPVRAQRGEAPIYFFGNDASNGKNPRGKLSIDQNGNLYGATSYGGVGCGTLGCGSVFEITPLGAGAWALTNYYDFTGNLDGEYPQTGLVSDSSGNLYGTTVGAGLYQFGTVFELSPRVGGRWKLTVLYSFTLSDSGNPQHLGQVTNSTLYGALTDGNIFSMHQTPSGWKYKVIATVPGSPKIEVLSALLLGNGVMYGTSEIGGSGTCLDPQGNNTGCGFVFQVRVSNGIWTPSIIYNFQGAPNDGAYPFAKVIKDAEGNLYGTTLYGGSRTCFPIPAGCGTLFKLFESSGQWRREILHNFSGGIKGGTTDGSFPNSEPVFDRSNHLIGTASGGGPGNFGVIYKWSPSPPHWTILSDFSGADGYAPEGPLTLDSHGFLYGTTNIGGVYGFGSVYTLLP